MRRHLARILRWIIAADCTCGALNAPDCFHHPTCPHPLRRTDRIPR